MRRPRITIVLVALAAIILVILLYWHYSVVPIDWERTKTIFDVVQSTCTIIAILVGAAWAYFNYFKGRTYRPRLEPKIAGKLSLNDGVSYLVTTAQLKNVGLSRIQIKQEGTALQVFSYYIDAPISKARQLEQKYLAIFSVFEAHGWIEPGEVIEDQNLILLPGGAQPAIRLELRIVSDGIEWNTATIVETVSRIEAQSPKVLVGNKESKHELRE
jgi:hypothetical protein